MADAWPFCAGRVGHSTAFLISGGNSGIRDCEGDSGAESQFLSSNSDLCCVEFNMQHFLYQLFAVTTSLILALPPGSCGAFVQHDRADSAPVKKASCCHETASEAPCESGHSPAKPSVKCCCGRDAALPETSVQPTSSHDLALAPVAAYASLNVGSLQGGAAAVNPAHSGPRLQILLCVWRC